MADAPNKKIKAKRTNQSKKKKITKSVWLPSKTVRLILGLEVNISKQKSQRSQSQKDQPGPGHKNI